jgi:hypothetical protein
MNPKIKQKRADIVWWIVSVLTKNQLPVYVKAVANIMPTGKTTGQAENLTGQNTKRPSHKSIMRRFLVFK